LTQNLLLFGVIFPTSFCCVMKSALQRLRQSFSPSTSLDSSRELKSPQQDVFISGGNLGTYHTGMQMKSCSDQAGDQMRNLRVGLTILVVISFVWTAVPATAEPLKNIVLVHGAWVDASGWRPVYEILTRNGFLVTMVQEPETAFADDVVAAKRILDLQNGPTLLVGHSYGGSIITQAGIHPNVVGLVYVAAHAPDVGEDEGALGKNA
jgi:pimeloyl-ACP methyl ester carboxylesterase